jgi:hypothetical protein
MAKNRVISVNNGHLASSAELKLFRSRTMGHPSSWVERLSIPLTACFPVSNIVITPLGITRGRRGSCPFDG